MAADFIFWGLTKLYERTLAQRQGRSSRAGSLPAKFFSSIGLFVVVGGVVVLSEVKNKLDENFEY